MNNASQQKLRRFADRIGVVASVTCALHCLLLPVLLAAGTALSATFLGDEAFHKSLLWLIIPAAVLAFGIGCRRHKDRLVLTLALIGLVGLVLAGTVLHDLLGEDYERIATLLSATLLVVAHVRNYRLCRSADCDHHYPS